MIIAKTLKGGDPRSLGKTNEVVEYVMADQSKLDELFVCIFSPEATVRMRAGDALEKVCRARPDWLVPYVDTLLGKVAVIDQPSIQWHLAQMIGELDLNPSQYNRVVNILKNNLENSTDWIVLNYSLEVFAQFVRKDASLKPYFIKQLHKHQKNQHKSVAKRATKLLSDL